ncbi:MAG: hypothetical protein JXB29_12370, partial [Sedimentisphaerales bacterium]|nr:hypothetical protein [Sedimentisphaerales bacterium]
MKKQLIIYSVSLIAMIISYSTYAVDSDGDGISDPNDNCWYVINPDQTDSNNDCPEKPFMTDPSCGNACDGYCEHFLLGDINYDCKIDFLDFIFVAMNWLIDCNTNPNDPACISLYPDSDGDGWDSSVDCDDNDPNEFPGQSWYPDCDDDGVYSSIAIFACDEETANAASPCGEPLGGWSHSLGSDCNDNNAQEFPGQSWYP